MQCQRQLAVVYTVPEVLNKVNYMRELGFLEHEIHLFSKEIRELDSFKLYSDIHLHQAGNLFDAMKSLITGHKLYEVCLLPFQFSEDELHHYGQLIRKGAYFIIAEHDFPIEKEPTARQFMQWTNKSKQLAQPANIKVQHEKTTPDSIHPSKPTSSTSLPK